MLTSKPRLQSAMRRRWLGVTAFTTAMLLAFAGPAAAAETIQGSGAGVGHSTIDVRHTPEPSLCLPGKKNSQYVVDITEGSVIAAEETSVAEYLGPLTVTVTLDEDFWFSPAGTFQDNMCLIPAAVPATISVNSASSSLPNPLGGSVTCTPDTGQFQRVNTTLAFNEVGSDGDGSCTVTSGDGSPSVTVEPVTHAFVGNEYPCLEDPITSTSTCPDPVDDTHVQGEWTVTGADDTN